MLLVFAKAVSPEAFQVASALKALIISLQTVVSKNFKNTPEYETLIGLNFFILLLGSR